MKENKVGGLTLLDSKFTIKLQYSRQYSIGKKRQIDQWNKTELRNRPT